MTTGDVTVGIVGIGFGQRVLVPAFNLDPRCRVGAICASTYDRAAAVAKTLSIENAYGDWRLLLESPDVHALAIATPPAAQPEIAMAALQMGKPVFCEKPLAACLAEANTLAFQAKSAAVANIIDFEFPEIPSWQKIKRLLDGAAIGRIRHFSVNWNVETYVVRNQLDSWKLRPEQGGGTLASFVSHVFYYLEWLFGPLQELSCRMFATSRAEHSEDSGDTFVALSCVTQGGVPGSVSVSTDAFLGTGHSVEIYGDEGTLVLRNDSSDYVSGFRLFQGSRASTVLSEIRTDDPTASGDGRIAAVARVVSRCIDWIESGKPERPDFADGVRVQHLLD